MPSVETTYGLPTGTAINYGNSGFPQWVYDLANAFNLRASTYPGHQETDRIEIGFARNTGRLNRGIDWAGSVSDMQRFAEYCLRVKSSLEQVIWQNPNTLGTIGVAGGQDVSTTGYYQGNYSGHRDHVHTRQSAPIPLPDSVIPTEPKDTLFADVSEWQVPVNDSYPYRVLSIRSNDGTYLDKDFQENYRWCVSAVESGRLEFFIVYFVWYPNWQQGVAALKAQVGEPHSKMVVMIDVESWEGKITGDQSVGINAAFWAIAGWLGNPKRVVGYGNTGDLNRLWPNKPVGIRLIVAGYGSLPTYPGMIAHQYTNGEVGCGSEGLPCGTTPFGRCDMNSANGLTAKEFARELGIDVEIPSDGGVFMALSAKQQQELYDKIMAYPGVPEIGGKWPSRAMFRRTNDGIDDTVGMILNIDANAWDVIVVLGALTGVDWCIELVEELANHQGPSATNELAVKYATGILRYISTT